MVTWLGERAERVSLLRRRESQTPFLHLQTASVCGAFLRKSRISDGGLRRKDGAPDSSQWDSSLLVSSSPSCRTFGGVCGIYLDLCPAVVGDAAKPSLAIKHMFEEDTIEAWVL